MIKYTDPFNNDPYGKLKGDKSDVYLKIEFSEAKIYEVDNGYILAGYITGYVGVTRAYKPEEPLQPGLCAIPIYEREFELWQKNKEGKNTPVKCQPSLFETSLVSHLKSNFIPSLDAHKALKGSIGFLPNAQLQGLSEFDIAANIPHNCQLEVITATGKLPEYKPYTASERRASNGKYSLTPNDKLAWLKKELVSGIASSNFTEETSLSLLLKQVIYEHKDDETFLALYTDILKTLIA